MNRHAYLIVANSNWNVVSSCLRLIDDERNDVYLLVDRKTHLTEHQIDALKEHCHKSNVSINNSIIINWGGYSQIRAVLYLLKEAVGSGVVYDYFHFLQGSDLPIKTQNQIHSFFENHSGMEFISVEKERSMMAYDKCLYYHFFCHNRFFRKNKLMKALNFSLVYFQKLVGIKHNTDIELYQGSALFSITNDFARYLLSREREVYRRFRFALAADECFIQTIAMNSPFKCKIAGIDKESSSDARLIDRTRPDGKNTPHIWKVDELESIINQPKEICYARKFDECVDLNIVKEIETHILHKVENLQNSGNN